MSQFHIANINFPSTFTILDLSIVFIIVISTYLGYRKGFTYTIFSLLSLVVSLFLVNIIYPTFSAFLMGTAIFYGLRDSIIQLVGVSYALEDITASLQSEIINDLPLPGFIISIIEQNNTVEIHNVLDVRTIETYIGGFLASIIIDIISLVVVFLVVSITVWMVFKNLSLVAKLPIIKHFDKFLGAAFGVFRSVIFIWIALVAYTPFLISPNSNSAYILSNSHIAMFFYERNLILAVIIGFLT